MIFVTVGTHEQPFNRLLQYIDGLKEQKIITEKVIMQIGFSTYNPRYCEWEKVYSFSKMNELITEARIIVTHGGPSSFIAPLQIGKIPVVVPRQKKYGEHVNDHQLEFCREVAIRQRNIIEVEDIEKLGEVLLNYNQIAIKKEATQSSNNQKFCKEFEKLVNDMFDHKEKK